MNYCCVASPFTEITRPVAFAFGCKLNPEVSLYVIHKVALHLNTTVEI
jgi:hypothetical protein